LTVITMTWRIEGLGMDAGIDRDATDGSVAQSLHLLPGASA
jgi:hypothetical protein